jgi:hypothetical protein
LDATTGMPRAAGVQGEAVERLLAVATGAGQLQAQVAVEVALPVGQLLLGQVVAVLRGQAAGQALAAGQQDQAAAALAHPFRAHGNAALGAVAFHPGPGEQLGQVEVAAVVAHQRGQPPRGLPGGGGHHQVGAGHRLDAHRLARLVELDQREQVVEVGDRQRRQPQLHRPAQQVGPLGLGRVRLVRFLGHADDRVRKRVLGMDMEVDEAGHAAVRVPGGQGANKA